MHLELLQDEVEIPEGVTITIDGSDATVKGEKGELTRKIGSRSFEMKLEGNKITFKAENATRKVKRLLQTGKSHLKNMIKGVSEGHTYKLKICSGHFPMNVSMKGNILEVKNFIGEAVPRTLKIKEGVDVQVNGQDITVESINKELAGNTASAIELLTRRPGFDQRVFQDGLYIVEKDGKEL